MKKLALLLGICLMYFVSGAQEEEKASTLPVDDDTKLITYKEVVEKPGTSAELYDRAIEWIKEYFKNPSGVTKKKDKENGLITGTHSIKIYNVDKKGNKTPAGVVHYNFKIQFKDTKYRVTITDFNLRAASYTPIEPWLTEKQYQNDQYKGYLDQIDAYAKKWLEDLKKGMEPKEEKDDNW